MREDLEKLTKEELINYIEDLSKNWLVIDGTWFQVAEREYGLERAIELDVEQWKRFTVIEAKRIMKGFNIPKNGGIPALIKALKFRVYANINVLFARKSRGLPDFPCKPVGVIEYGDFAKTIDPRIETKCICCPPESHPESYYCAWEFTLKI